jgi:hypothetical protein
MRAPRATVLVWTRPVRHTDFLAGRSWGCRVLTTNKLIAFASTTDLAMARAFYEGVIGLHVVQQDAYACVLDPNGTMLRATAVAEVARPGYTCSDGVSLTSCRASPHLLARSDNAR